MTELTLLFNVVTALFTFVLTILVAGVAWYFREHVIIEVEKNTAFRQFLMGSEIAEDQGEIHELREISEQMEEQHEESNAKLEHLMRYTRRIADSVEPDIQEPPKDWRGDD